MAKKRNNNTLIILLVVVVAALMALLIWKNKGRPDGEKVTAEAAQERSIVELVSASGKVFPVTEVKISSDVSGEIVELYVEEGDSVVSGQVLAKIDPDAYQSQVERGVATLNSTKAQLANARSQVENLSAQKEQIEAQLINARDIHQRNEKLYKDGVISELDFESSLTNVRTLEANLRSAEAAVRAAKETVNATDFSVKSSEAALKELRTSLNRTTIYAPVSGIISLLNVEKGERVVGTVQMTGTELMRIADLNSMEVQVEVSENDIPRVSIGDPVDIEVDAYIGRKFKGKVSKIANSASNTATGAATISLTTDQVTNFIVTIIIDPASYQDLIRPNQQYPFRPGMSASVDITTNIIEGALSVPIQAVGTRELEEDADEELGKETDQVEEVVFVVLADSVSLRKVVTGVQDDTYIQILEGLEAGEEVVTGPYAAVSRKLEQGSAIQIVEQDELFSNE